MQAVPRRKVPVSDSHRSGGKMPNCDTTIGEELIRPTELYVKPIVALFKEEYDIHGLAHITGGGFIIIHKAQPLALPRRVHQRVARHADHVQRARLTVEQPDHYGVRLAEVVYSGKQDGEFVHPCLCRSVSARLCGQHSAST